MGTIATGAGGTGVSTGAPSMDLHKAILALYEEKQQIDQVIASLEEYLRVNVNGASSGRRGRKSMGSSERQEVSVRMRTYWAERRRSRREVASA